MAKCKDHSQPDGEASTKRIREEAVESPIVPAAEEAPIGKNELLCSEVAEITSCWQVLDRRDVQKPMP
jgi:hypothetical protein